MIHTTVGIYLNGEWRVNGVHSDYLQKHIWYNKRHRPGRALFVDGECVHRGYFDEEEIKEQQERIKHIHVNKDTAPYQ